MTAPLVPSPAPSTPAGAPPDAAAPMRPSSTGARVFSPVLSRAQLRLEHRPEIRPPRSPSDRHEGRAVDGSGRRHDDGPGSVHDRRQPTADRHERDTDRSASNDERRDRPVDRHDRSSGEPDQTDLADPSASDTTRGESGRESSTPDGSRSGEPARQSSARRDSTSGTSAHEDSSKVDPTQGDSAQEVSAQEVSAGLGGALDDASAEVLDLPVEAGGESDDHGGERVDRLDSSHAVPLSTNEAVDDAPAPSLHDELSGPELDGTQAMGSSTSTGTVAATDATPGSATARQAIAPTGPAADGGLAASELATTATAPSTDAGPTTVAGHGTGDAAAERADTDSEHADPVGAQAADGAGSTIDRTRGLPGAAAPGVGQLEEGAPSSDPASQPDLTGGATANPMAMDPATEPSVTVGPPRLESTPSPPPSATGANLGAALDGVAAPGDAASPRVDASPSASLPATAGLGDDQADELWAQVQRALHRVRTGPDGTELRLRLHPAELGELLVQVRAQGEHLSVRLVASSAAAHQALVADQQRLAEELAEAGFADGSVDVGEWGAGAFGGDRPPGRHGATPPRSPAVSSAAGWPAASADDRSTIDPSRPGRRRAGLVDLVL